MSVFMWSDYWKVIIISGTYVDEPQPTVTGDQSQAVNAAGADEEGTIQAETSSDDNSVTEDNTGSDNKIKGKDDSPGLDEDDGGTTNTNNNADSDSEDDPEHNKSTKYFVPPHPPTSQLVLVIYGDLGTTGELPLTAENPQDLTFAAGEADEFKANHCIFAKRELVSE